MKIKFILKRTAFFLLSATLLFPVNSCKKPVNPIEGLELIIDYNIIETTIDIQLMDAATGNLLTGAASQGAFIKYAGADEQAVVDVLGVRPAEKKFAVVRGIATMALVPNAPFVPTVDDPVTFNVIAQVPGYLTSTKEVSVSETGRKFVVLSLIPLSEPPSGVYVRQEPAATTLQGGRVIVPATVTVPGESATITLPEGMVIRDAGGNPLSGDVNVTIVRFDNTDPAALEAFPGGLTPTVTRLDGSTLSGTFFSAGFVAIEITDQNGNVASTFEDGSLQLVSEIEADTYNPITQTSIAAGDEVPYWSLDETTGIWTEEGIAVAEQVAGKLQFEVQLTHLSFYNFDWLIGILCPNGSPFRFHLNAALPAPFLIKGRVYRQVDDAFINTIMMWVENDQPIYTTYAPAGIPVYIVWDTEGSPFINVDPASQPTVIDDLCSSQPVDVNLLINDDPNVKTIRIEVSLVCSSLENPIVIKPSFTANYIPADGSGGVVAIEMVEGVALIPGIILGKAYYVWITYDGVEYGKEVVATQENYTYIDYEIPADVCEQVTGALNELP